MAKRQSFDGEVKGKLCRTLLQRQFGDLPANVWASPKHKFDSVREFKAINMFAKKYGLKTVVAAVIYNVKLKSLSNYAAAEVFLQQEVDAERRRDLPKDTGPLLAAKQVPIEDLRENRPSVEIKMPLFERLTNLGAGNG